MSPRVIIADDHPTFRAGLRAFLEQEAGCTILAETSDGAATLAAVEAMPPDVLVLDLQMPGLSGLDVLDRLRQSHPDLPVLILSAYEDDEYIFGVLERGAAGYLTKQESLYLIGEAVQGAARGETGWLSRRIAALFVGQRRSRPEPGALDALSEREREVLLEVARGYSNAEVGERLFITESTVKKHVHQVYAKIGVQTRAQAVAWAWAQGLVNGDDAEAAWT
ncbi:MAG: response regulator transcription factor [Bacteroidota bacterium]